MGSSGPFRRGCPLDPPQALPWKQRERRRLVRELAHAARFSLGERRSPAVASRTPYGRGLPGRTEGTTALQLTAKFHPLTRLPDSRQRQHSSVTSPDLSTKMLVADTPSGVPLPRRRPGRFGKTGASRRSARLPPMLLTLSAARVWPKSRRVAPPPTLCAS
jgi:hypothetical protein